METLTRQIVKQIKLLCKCKFSSEDFEMLRVIIEENIQEFNINELAQMLSFLEGFDSQKPHKQYKTWEFSESSYNFYNRHKVNQAVALRADVLSDLHWSLKMVIKAELWNREIEREHIYERRRNRKLNKDS